MAGKVGVLEITVVLINDKWLEYCRHAENKNRYKEEKAAGGDVKTIQRLLKIKKASDNHSNAGNENEIEHHAANDSILHDGLSTGNFAAFALIKQ